MKFNETRIRKPGAAAQKQLFPCPAKVIKSSNMFRYDATAGQYIFNLSTKGYTKGTYKILAKPDDGSSYSVKFSLK